MVIMFGTQWAYALIELLAAIIVYIYIGQANPGYFPGKYIHCIAPNKWKHTHETNKNMLHLSFISAFI